MWMYQITYFMMSDSHQIYRNNFLKIMSDGHHQPHSYTWEAKIIFLQMVLPDLDKFLLLVLIFYWQEI